MYLRIFIFVGAGLPDFQNKNTNLYIYLKACIWSILWPFAILLSFFGMFGDPLVHLTALVGCTKKDLATLRQGSD
jgi:hypothetical protein